MLAHNQIMDGIESLILAHGCAGMTSQHRHMVEGVPGCSRRGCQRLRLN